MDKIRVVPNPYYGYNQNQSSFTDRFVTFRRLPEKCTIKIYSLNGDMIRQIDKNNMDAMLRWDLRNLENNPVASGMYIALIDAVRIGQKIINDILKYVMIDIVWCEPKNGFVTSVSCGKLFNMPDKEFKKKYLGEL